MFNLKIEIFTAFSAARSEEYLEVAFAVFAAFKLVENPIRKHSEALSASILDKLSTLDDMFHHTCRITPVHRRTVGFLTG